jgi:hypothetical protein
MTNSNTSTATRKASFVPKGCAARQASHAAGIAKAYRTEANIMRRKADCLDRRAAKLEEANAAGSPITRAQIIEAINSGLHQANYRACRLAGVSTWLTRVDALKAVYGDDGSSTSAATVVATPNLFAHCSAAADQFADLVHGLFDLDDAA